MTKVKAHKVGTFEEKKKKKEHRQQIFLLVMLALIVMGFTLTALVQPKFGAEQQPRPVEEGTTVIEASSSGMMQGTVAETDRGYTILGGSVEILRMSRQLDGELMVLGGETLLFNTEEDLEDIQVLLDDNMILYRTGLCDSAQGPFNCLLEERHDVGQTEFFDTYALDKQSSYLQTMTVGLPLPEEDLPEPPVVEPVEEPEPEPEPAANETAGEADNQTDEAGNDTEDDEGQPVFNEWGDIIL